MTTLAVARRPIVLPWACQRSGDCCKMPRAVTMTHDERRALLAHPGARGKALTWDLRSPTWAHLKAQPCPLLTADNLCSVHTARPYNCRRFACFRPQPEREPLELGGPLDTLNLWDRFRASKAVRQAYKKIQKVAQVWAQTHGWTKDMGR